EQFVKPGENFTYEFKAEPYGIHLFHCHSTPLKEHIARGMYGVYIVDPKESRAPANELVMMMNAFDTNFDGENEVYAVNTKAFYYADHPIKVKLGELVRIYVVNIVEFDPVNSIHIHGNFFEEYKTGTRKISDAFTDIIELGQGERSILELRFKYPGKFMFHAHQTEFAELGWTGFFEVEP
ncbi:MAG: multicopper oxidase domain-containing protein, partial [Candidatus Aenigmarchaeota archaeon]|nr:multicopper oxidase domain-containing protein [Candidatus Aenigmarchaeota archaeon]